MFAIAFALIIASIIPVCMVACGLLWVRKPPSDRFGTSGFKTQRARASMESWSFAHRHLGRMLIPLGIVSAIASVAVVLTARANPYFTLLAAEGAQLLALGCTCLETELALRKNFDGDGHPMNRYGKV